jgi:hypothetical protein
MEYRKEFRGSVIDLEYFYNVDPIHRRSFIKKIEKVGIKSESTDERNLIISLQTIVSENI